MEKNGIGITDWDLTIYRVFSMHWFSDLITNNRNGLVNPAFWEDPFENFFLQNNAVTRSGELVSMETLRESWYGQCWTRNRDSDAMWRIYSPKNDGVRVTTTIRKLFTGFYDSKDSFASLKYLIGSVEYLEKTKIEKFLLDTTFMDLAFGGQPHNFAKTLCIKRPEFSHENEIRLLFQDTQSNVGKNRVATFPFDAHAIISEVALDPRLTDTQFVEKKNELISLGCKIPIIHSDLYRINPTTIRLE